MREYILKQCGECLHGQMELVRTLYRKSTWLSKFYSHEQNKIQQECYVCHIEFQGIRRLGAAIVWYFLLRIGQGIYDTAICHLIFRERGCIRLHSYYMIFMVIPCGFATVLRLISINPGRTKVSGFHNDHFY